MRTIQPPYPLNHTARAGERGAALITMLLVAALILAAGGALIMSTASTATNANDSTTSKQAYYAAEAGLQMSLNALRGNMAHDNTVAVGTTMSFRTAVTPDTSNGAGRSGGNNNMCGSTDADAGRCRLAGWLPYANPANAASTIAVGNSAYRVSVYDPDNSHNVAFSTSGKFTVSGLIPSEVSADKLTLYVPSAVSANRLEITYIPRASTSLANAVSGAVSDFGSFSVKQVGLGVVVALSKVLAKFDLTVDQTSPWQASQTFKANLASPAAAFCPSTSMQVAFPQSSVQADGTTLLVTGLNTGALRLPCLAVAGAQQNITVPALITAPQPKRLVLRSRGFGPKWSEKRLEATLDRANLNFQAPATITVRGADDCTPMAFDSGNSNAKNYSGKDINNVDPDRPPFAVSACDENDAESGISKPGTVSPDPQLGLLDNGTAPAGASMTTTPVDTPSFLQTADKARAYLNELEAAARTEGRYFHGPRSVTTADGTPANPGMTFVDGDCTLGSGVGGLVVCTGTVTTSGNISFDGVLLVLGGGSLTRNGGGNGDINGSIVISKFARTWPASENGQSHPFLAPTYNTNGGGNSDVAYSSTAVNNALSLLGGSHVSGVLEY